MKSVLRHMVMVSLVMIIAVRFESLWGQSSPGTAEEAAALFDKGEYEKALEIWYSMVEEGYAGTAVYYNIGLAESRSGQTVASILAYEKALRFSPGNKAVQQGLTAERKKIQNSTIPVPSFFLVKWYKGFLAMLRPGGWAWFGLLLTGLLVAASLFQHRTTPIRRITRHIRIVLVTAGLLSFLCGVLRYQQIYAAGEAITGKISEVHQSADPASPVNRVLHPGEKVVILDAIGEWQRISMLNLDEGWIKRDGLVPIRP